MPSSNKPNIVEQGEVKLQTQTNNVKFYILLIILFTIEIDFYILFFFRLKFTYEPINNLKF